MTTGGTPSRVTRLVLTNKSLTGTIPPELAQLTGLTELKLDNNRLTGCIPLPLLQISNHDLDDLSLSYCGDPPPTPGGLSTSQADGTYTISWDAVTGADLYEVQHRAGTDADWVALPTTASTSATYSPEGGALCGPIEFRVRARGDGITFIPDWSEPTSASEVASTATSGLITDCELLLSIKGTLAGTSTLNWSMDTGIASWDGVTIGGTPSRITQLDLRINRLNGSIPSQIGSLDKLQQLYLGHNQLTGAIPPELGNLTELTQLWLNINQLTGPIPARLGDLTALVGLGLHYNRLTEEIPAELGNLTELEQMFLENNRLVGAIPLQLGGLDLSFISLAGNSLTGCIPVGLRDVRDNDLNTLGLAYCGAPPAPADLSVDLTAEAFSVEWSAVTGAASYEIKYRIAGSEAAWVTRPTTANTSGTFTPTGDSPCSGTYEFQVRAQGDGKGYEATWGAAAETTGTCNNVPAFGEESYAFSIAEDAALDAAVGSVSATDDDTGDTLTYAFTDEDTVEKFTIASATGAITVAVALDYETTPSYTLSVQVNDGNGGTASAEVVITVTNVPEGLPAAPTEVEVSLSGNTFTVTWGEVSGANEYEAQYRKDASEDWTSLEAVMSTSTAYTAAGVLNCGTTYDFQVRSHGDGETHLADWGEFSAPVSELVETDTCNNVPAFGEESYAFSIAEDAALDAAVGSVSATDDDTGDTLTYAFTDEDTVEKFAIASATGAITVAVALDYETTPSYTLSVQVNDDNGGTASAEVVVTVTNVPEGLPPMPASLSVSLIDSTFSFTWDTVANAAKYRVQFHTGDGNWADAATDITGTSASFSPSDGPACGTTYSFQVLPFGDGVTYIEDWGTASDSESVTTDACNQIPAFTNAPYSFSVFEDAEVGYEVGTVTAEDLDTDDTLSFSISEGNEAGKFNISSSTGAITVAVALDYETTPSYTLNVQVNDDNGGISSSSVSISIIPLTCSNGVVVADVADNAGLVGDCQALLDGKQTLAGSAVLSWSARTAIANWDGIVLGGTPKRVTDLQLGSRGLSGSIPSTLGSLSNLTKLYLFNNQLSGAIPTQLGSLSNLTHLFLNSNRLTGSIPKEIGEISTLTNLSLGSNQLTESIPAELGRLSNLTSLVLNNNSLTGDLPTELGSLSSLQILWLQENQLSGTIPTELGALSNLTQLLLGYNQLTGSIPAELADLNNLESLQLKGNQLSGCIPPALRSVAKNDLNQIGLLNCAPAPQGLSVSLSDGTFSITWNAVTGASQFEVQYRTDSEEDWVSLPATAGTSSTFSPDGGPACGKTFEFQVRSFGDGATYGAAWGVSSDEVSQATSACS